MFEIEEIQGGLVMGAKDAARKWSRQAEADLKAANNSLTSCHYEWSCFQSQQSAEKALKAYLYSLGFTSEITYSAKRLIKKCVEKEKKFAEVKEAASFLDNYYIPTRYPNGLDVETAPADYYEKEDAEKCVKYATSILKISKKYTKI